MKNKNKVRVRNQLFFHVYINYAIMLTVFAVLIGLIYVNLYENYTMKSYKEKLENQANSITKRLSRTIINGEEDSYLEYLFILDEINNDSTDIYTISNPDAKDPMDKALVNFPDYKDKKLPKDCLRVISAAFNKKTTHSSGYYENFGYYAYILGKPVTINNEVVGMVLLVSPVKEQKEVISSSRYLIILSALAALLISFIIAILFARGLAAPISRMRITALKLAEGHYETKTEINRKDEIGDLARSIDTLADELKANEIERENREQMRVDFFANVSHELRTPITVIRAYTEALVDCVVTDEEKINQYYIRMLSECKGMERLVGDLLILSKMQNPDFVVEKEPVNIAQVFDDLIRNVHAISEEKNITIKIQKDQSSYMMMGDYDRLRQMFLIILDNAIKFTKVNSFIYINLSKTDKLLVSIKDQGIGITPEDLPYIFDKFYKSKLKQNEKGSGLGLAIAKQIALKHGGTIEVNSSVGVGTEFVFRFQCLDDYVEELNLS